MSIALIVTKSYDKNFNQTGQLIDRDDWLNLARSYPDLVERISPHVANLPDGSKLSMNAGDAEFEMIVAHERLPLLYFFKGELKTKFTEDLEDPQNPRRKRIAEIARRLDALITHDAGDEILDW
jgi:hypothetical protein